MPLPSFPESFGADALTVRVNVLLEVPALFLAVMFTEKVPAR